MAKPIFTKSEDGIEINIYKDLSKICSPLFIDTEFEDVLIATGYDSKTDLSFEYNVRGEICIIYGRREYHYPEEYPEELIEILQDESGAVFGKIIVLSENWFGLDITQHKESICDDHIFEDKVFVKKSPEELAEVILKQINNYIKTESLELDEEDNERNED